VAAGAGVGGLTPQGLNSLNLDPSLLLSASTTRLYGAMENILSVFYLF
jgi:hypothetical protein